MATLVYSAITSLDGYTADPSGAFDWCAPDADVFACINDLERPVGTYLYGRRMYDTMAVWETLAGTDDTPPHVRDFADIWRAATKIVYSTTLTAPTTTRTRLEPSFDPAVVRHMKEEASEPISIGGANLAGQAMAAGLVDEVHLFLTPVTVGGGTAALPRDRMTTLALMDVERFPGGVVHLRYRVGP